MFTKILVAYDGSDGARAALRVGIGLAKSLGAELHSISVEEHLPHYAATIDEVEDAKDRIDAYFRTLTKEARDQALLAGVELQTVVRQGHEVLAAANSTFSWLAITVTAASSTGLLGARPKALCDSRPAQCSWQSEGLVHGVNKAQAAGAATVLVRLEARPLRHSAPKHRTASGSPTRVESWPAVDPIIAREEDEPCWSACCSSALEAR